MQEKNSVVDKSFSLLLLSVMEKKVRACDLAYMAGKKRQSPRTGFVHVCPKRPEATDLIALYENFLFVLALFRQKKGESVVEGIDLLGKLLAFQLEGGDFPTYLHEYPTCWDFSLKQRIAPLLLSILHEFGGVIPRLLKERIERALQFPFTPFQRSPSTPIEWLERLTWDAALQQREPSYPIPYHRDLQIALFPGSTYEKGERTPWPIEYLLAEKEGFSPRLLQDHPAQLYAGLVPPIVSSLVSQEPFSCIEQKEGGVEFLWGQEKLFSFFSPKGVWDGKRLRFCLEEMGERGRGDLFEVFFFVSKEASLSIEGSKGTLFREKERLEISGGGLTLSCTWKVDGGDLLGHIAKGNRPNCLHQEGWEAFDWKVGLRTLRREAKCQIDLSIDCHPHRVEAVVDKQDFSCNR